MKKMKKKLFPLAMVLLLALCAGCGATGGAPAQSTPLNNGAEDGQGTAPDYVLKLGTHLNVGSIGDITSNDFAGLLAEKTDDRVRVDVFPGAQLGQEFEAAEAVMIGSMDLTYVSTTAYNDVVDGFAVDCLPFLFDSDEEFYYIFNESEVGEVLGSNMIDRGARILTWIPCGFRQMYFSDREITSFTQIEGMKIRAPESMLYLEMLRAIGANPISVTWGETYSALQTGLAEGCECPYTSITDANMQDVVKYGLITDHMILCQAVVINEALFQSFPSDIQQAVLDAGREAGENAFARVKDQVADARKKIEDSGVVLHELPDGELEQLQERMAPVREKWIGDDPVRQEIVDLILKVKEEYKAM